MARGRPHRGGSLIRMRSGEHRPSAGRVIGSLSPAPKRSSRSTVPPRTPENVAAVPSSLGSGDADTMSELSGSASEPVTAPPIEGRLRDTRSTTWLARRPFARRRGPRRLGERVDPLPARLDRAGHGREAQVAGRTSIGLGRLVSAAMFSAVRGMESVTSAANVPTGRPLAGRPRRPRGFRLRDVVEQNLRLHRADRSARIVTSAEPSSSPARPHRRCPASARSRRPGGRLAGESRSTVQTREPDETRSARPGT